MSHNSSFSECPSGSNLGGGGIRLSVAHDELPLELEKCIICQLTTDEEPKSFETGRKRVREASQVRQDIVTKRLRGMNDETTFVYHISNACYKHYTHKKSIDLLKKNAAQKGESQAEIDGVSNEPSRQSRSASTPRSQPISTPDFYKLPCAVCGFVKHNNDYSKCRISETDRATNFLKAAVYFKDDVYTRVCDLDNVPAVFGADIYCHKNCIRRYIKSYDDKVSKTSQPKQNAKTEAWEKVSSEIRRGLSSGLAYELSNITKLVNDNLPIEKHIRNRETKALILNDFGVDVIFTLPKCSNKSSIVHSKDYSQADMVNQLRDIDPIRMCADMIRSSLLEVDFNLDDSFCDASDLEDSWNEMVMPDPVARFFSSLFKVDYDVLKLKASEMQSHDQHISKTRIRQILALFQIMYYDLHNGRKKTPMHVMNSEIIHDTCKSSTLVTAYNHLGLGQSYEELQRHHNDMATFIVKDNDNNVPLPSHFDPDEFTTGALDNFDHEEASLSGIGGTHDTVMVLFQEDSNVKRQKPKRSESNITHGNRKFEEDLPCQQLKEFHKPIKRPKLSESYVIPDELYNVSPEEYTTQVLKDIAWTLSRCDTSEGQLDILPEDQAMPSWSASNSVWTEEQLATKRVGFLPILPNPVTQHSTVYTAMKTMQDVLSQLQQPCMAVACDEAVFCIAREIQMMREEEFSNLVLVMGSFHMIKVVLNCTGKYVQGSGAESILIESGAFGMNVVQSVLSGKHYVRSVKGMLMLSEALERIQWKEFFKSQSADDYSEVFDIVSQLKAKVAAKDHEASRILIDAFKESSVNLMADFKNFIQDGRSKNETFQYWDNFIEIVHKLQNLIRSDREGNWPLHLDTVQDLLGLFAAMDATNYLRWCSLYLEDMRRLPETAPEVHESFVKGSFVVKRTKGNFKAVGMDMCLEQTINKASKSTAGIIGSTRQKNYVAQWQIIYHEMMAVNHLHRSLTGVRNTTHEMMVNHEFSKHETECGEQNVQAIINYILVHENPFLLSPRDRRLHNILTQDVMTPEITKDLLEALDIGRKKYIAFRHERLVLKNTEIRETIHRSNLKTFKSIQHKNKATSSGKKSKTKDSSYAQRQVDIALSRGHQMKDILPYDITPPSKLFDDTGHMKKAAKHELVAELEKNLSESDSRSTHASGPLVTAYLVDVMANVRQTSTKDSSNFGEYCSAICGKVKSSMVDPDSVYFGFDSYKPGTIKDSERERRCTLTPIETATSLSQETILPKAMDRFWPSTKNKLQLQSMLHKVAVSKAKEGYFAREVVVGIVADETTVRVTNSGVDEVPELDLECDEADELLVHYARHAVRAGATRLVILTCDSDSVFDNIYYCDKLQAEGLKELWVKAGLGASVRFIPIHTLVFKIGRELSQILPALQMLTGSDYTSKLGSKQAALRASPVKYLKEFGVSSSTEGMESTIDQAEEYLVQVLQKGSACKTMDQLRIWKYYNSKKRTLSDLPPTSGTVRGHIKRSLYATITMTQLYQESARSLDPRDYGYHDSPGDDLLWPTTFVTELPSMYTLCCTCKTCNTARCSCRKAGVQCSKFCKCLIDDSSSCENPICT